MTYSRNYSLGSMGSSLTSYSSEASLELYEDRLKAGIETIQKSPTTLQELVGSAQNIINEKFAPHTQSTYRYKNDSEETSLGLDKVMLAMLEGAQECGGESGQRYVASAILACSKEEDVVGALAALGTTWLTHLLFIFKTSRGDGNQLNKWPGKNSFYDDVIRRDGYKCVVTGYRDLSHPNPTKGDPLVGLVGAHILRREIGEYDTDHESKSFKSASTTFDILRNFARLPVQTLEELQYQIDDTSNGILLQHDAHHAFNKFYWCLQKTNEEHVYNLKIFKNAGILRKPENNRIAFEDHCSDFLPDSTSRKSNLPVDLPDPRYIAIHAAIAGILHTSGAGRFFDELLRKYEDDEGDIPAMRSWAELEALMGERLASESVTNVFQAIKVHRILYIL